jgi:peptidyl-prolyl cis-trans isomerase B (cyclophilin B)
MTQVRSLKVPLWLAASLLGAATLCGCGKSSDDPSKIDAGQTKKELLPPPRAAAPATPATPATPGAGAGKTAVADRLHQSFLEATRQVPPPDQRPPDRTMTGKSVGKLYGEVIRTWDTIRFTDEAGRRINYSATVETELGDIEIALDADAAPNHVRNFIALARAGYYDGLVFDRIHHEEDEDQPENGNQIQMPMPYEEIEAGCPLGTGDLFSNSIGYWLKPEFNDRLSHAEGTVGACRAIEEDTAACKFYITLSKAPQLDQHYTTFGKVLRGLEVARKIYMRPVILEDQDVNGSRRPEKPVVIRKVTIHAHTTVAGSAGL